MIYEFLYNDKPLTVWLPIALFIGTGGLLAITLYGFHSKNATKAEQEFFSTAGILITMLVGMSFLFSSAIYIYDHVTTPSENTRTTDLYKITKENNYLTFSAKKPYNHLYRTKTMEITYANSDKYVIVVNDQAYKIPKESVKE
jgi:hypothetical protein